MAEMKIGNFVMIDPGAITDITNKIKAAPDDQAAKILKDWLVATPVLDQHVRPGDVISAEFMNGLIDRMAALEGKVKVLEGKHKPPITPAPDNPVITNG